MTLPTVEGTFSGKLFCGYTVDDACNFDATCTATANFISQLYLNQNRPKKFCPAMYITTTAMHRIP